MNIRIFRLKGIETELREMRRELARTNDLLQRYMESQDIRIAGLTPVQLIRELEDTQVDYSDTELERIRYEFESRGKKLTDEEWKQLQELAALEPKEEE